MQAASALFRLLGDDARLRILRVLVRDRFNVSELTLILGLAQSGVSRHLGLLKEAGLVEESRDGLFSYYAAGPALRDADSPLRGLLDAEFGRADGSEHVRADEARVQEVLRVRKENFASHAGPDTRDGRQLVPGRSWAAWARALGLLLPPLEVVDVGCGDGYLTLEAARWARRVTAVDRSAAVLARARALAARRRVSNIVWKRGDMEKLPLPDASADVVLLAQALHHAAEPSRALAEAWRVLRPDGRLLLLDLRAHDEAWVHQTLGDRWRGFDDAQLRSLLRAAGFDDVRLGVGARVAGDPFTVLLASGHRPAAPARQARRPAR